MYNPDQDRYYNPYDNVRNEGNPMQGAAQAIKSIALIGGLNLIGGAITHRLSKSGGGIVKKWMNRPSGIRKQIAQRAYSVTSTVNQAKSDIKRAISKTSIGQAHTTRMQSLAGMKGKPGYGAARFTSAFKNPKTFISSVGSVWKQNVLSGMGVAYAVDSMLGISKDMGLEKKSWYDVPGQISNFGRWMVNDSIAGLAFGGAQRGLGAIGSIGMRSASKAFGGAMGRSLAARMAPNSPGIPRGARYEKYLKQDVVGELRSKQETKVASDMVKKGLSFLEAGKSIRDKYRSVQSALYTLPDAAKEAWRSKGSFGQRTKKAFSTINAALKNVKEMGAKDRVTPSSTIKYSGLRAIEALDKVASMSNVGSQASLASNGLSDHFIPELKRQANQKSFINKVFGFLEPLRNKDVINEDWIRRTQGTLSERYGNKTAETLMGNVLNMRVGNNIYRDWRGGKAKGAGVDLGAFDPIHVMRRGASWIANKRFHIPLSSMNFTLSELTGAGKYLSEAPSFEFFDRKPEFQFGNGSIGELARGKDASFMYANGKWAIFDGEGIREVDSKRKLYRAPRASRDKSYELKSLAINRLRDAAMDAGSDFNKIREQVDYYDSPKNTFLHFLDRRNIGLPSKLNEMLGNIDARLSGNKHYQQLSADIFGNGNILDGEKHLPLLDNLLTHTSQVQSRVLQNKNALQQIAHFVHDKTLADDILNVAFDDRALVDKLDSLDWRAGDWIKRTGFKRAVEEVKAFPKESQTHEVVKRLGPLSSMTSMDVARTNYIDDIFNKSYLTNPRPGEAHPLIAAVPGLLEQGIITNKEAKALKLHAKLSVFRDDGLVRNIAKSSDTFSSVLKKVRHRAKEEQWDVGNEIIDFVSNNRIKNPKIDFEQNRIMGGILKDAEFDPSDLSGGTSPYFSAPTGLRAMSDVLGKTMTSTTDMISEWLPFKKRYISHHGLMGGAKFIGGIMSTTALAFGSYKVADTLIATNPLFDDTSFDEGLTGFGADVVAKGRLGLARASDVTGVTGMMKYMHGLAPGSESTLPGMIVGGLSSMIAGRGALGVAKGVLTGAIVNRLASPYIPDMTKSHQELTEIYAGRAEVPMMKSPTWLLGGTPWEGSKVIGWSPNWYVRAKSRWQETDTKYGSAFRKLIHEPLPFIGFNVGDLVDPYYMERKHFFSRPYPVTGGIFDEMPIIGKPLSATIGRIIKPQKTMHQEFLTSDAIKAGGAGDPYPFAIRPPTLGEGLGLMRNQSQVRSTTGLATGGGNITMLPNKNWSETAAEDFLYDVSQFAGLKGFLGRSITERVFGEPTVMPTLQTAGRIASMSRSFYDKNLGGMGFLTEPIRRLIDKPEYKQYGINPIPNLMPNWLPSQFLSGDPYEKILRGELRLPGEAYSKTHTTLRRTMPARASMLGANEPQILEYFTGMITPTLKESFDIMEEGTEMHAAIQDSLAAEGLLLQAEALVFDVKNDISGHVDAIIRDGKGGGGRRALEIKTINEAGFQKLAEGPKYQHVGQINFYLKELGLNKGNILYINRDNPTMTKLFEVNYSRNRWEKDLAKLQKARQTAQSMLDEGVEDNYGYSYSWIDRLDILADVAPTSKEYKEVKTLVEKQIKFGVLTEKEVNRYKFALKKRQARLRKYELYPNRFKGKLLTPDTQKNIQSINEDIKAGADYSLKERAIGWAWENFTNTNFLLTNKLFGMKDPVEHYKMTRLYGKEYKPWDEPISSFVEPYSRGLASKTDPLAGSISYGTGGFVLGGPLGTVIGAGLGTAYGTVHGLYRFATGSKYIPNSIQEKRDIVSYFDAAKYAKADMLTQLSSGLTQKKFMDARRSTLTSINQGEGNVADLFRATPFTEKPYIESFLNTRNPRERKEILSVLPSDLGVALKKQWNASDQKEATGAFVENTSKGISVDRRHVFNRSVLDPGIQLEDIELKTIQEQGFDAHEFGLGWNEQMLRMQGFDREIQAADMNEVPMETPNLSSGHVRGIINNLFRQNGIKSNAMVYINNGASDANVINVTIRRDRSLTISRVFDVRKKFNL